MSFIEKLSHILSNSTKVIAQKSSQLVEVGKLNLSIEKRKEEISELFEHIGEYVYNRLKVSHYITREELVEEMARLENLQEDIENLEKLILNIKQANYCDNCKIILDDDIFYCPDCGKPVRYKNK